MPVFQSRSETNPVPCGARGRAGEKMPIRANGAASCGVSFGFDTLIPFESGVPEGATPNIPAGLVFGVPPFRRNPGISLEVSGQLSHATD